MKMGISSAEVRLVRDYLLEQEIKTASPDYMNGYEEGINLMSELLSDKVRENMETAFINKMTFKKGDKVFVEFEVLDTCHSSEYMLVKDKSGQIRQFLKSEAQAMPKKVVIPKFVAEWIEERKNEGKTMHEAIAYEVKADVFAYLVDNSEIFARAWLDSYEIDQEQLYTVEVPNPNNTSKNVLALRKLFTGIEICRVNAKTYKTDKHCQLTEAEIKQDFDWAWKWAKPVEE